MRIQRHIATNASPTYTYREMSPTLSFGNDVAETATRVARLPGTLEHLYLEENYQQNSKNGEKHEKVERQKRLIFVLARCQISQTTVLS